MSSFLTYTAVYAVLEKDGKVYLMRRANTGYRDGRYSLPAGHVEKGESLIEAVVREVREETGLEMKATDFELKHVTYRRAADRTYNDYFFKAGSWQGEPRNMEPEKCDQVVWAGKNDLPPETIEEVVQAIGLMNKNIPFSEIEVAGGHRQ